MRVSDLMSELVYVCPLHESLNEAMRTMWEHDLGCLPVVDAANQVVGVVTDRDVACAVFERGSRLVDIPVAEVMSHPAHTIGHDHPIAVAARIMRINQVRRLPVVDGRRHPIGLLSLDDLAQAMALGTLVSGVPPEEIADTLRAVTARHPR